jgi:hypothetical protein
LKRAPLAALCLLNALFLGACAKREHLTDAPTPTPGAMDVSYAQPSAQPTELMQTDNGMPAPPPEVPQATPTPPAVPTEAATEAPTPQPFTPTRTVVPTPGGYKHSYIVQRGDSLWDISGRPLILGDQFRWPLLFKANRSAIKDPDIIWPGLDLTWKESYPMPEIEEAVEKAKDTPKFVPHSSVRQQLPVEY